MEEKKNLCAMIPTDLHRKIMAEKEQLEQNRWRKKRTSVP